MPQKKLKLFNQDPPITAETITTRLENLRKVSDFKCETEAHRKARYALYKNLSQYESAFKILQGMIIEESEEFQKFRQEKIKLMRSFGAEEKQHPQMGSYYDDSSISDIVSYERDLEELEADFEEVIEEEEKRLKENRNISKMEIDEIPEPYMTDIENFPDTVTSKQLSSISFMIRDNDEKNKKTKQQNDE